MTRNNPFTRRAVLMLGTFLMATNLAFASLVQAEVLLPTREGGCGGSRCASDTPCGGDCICRPAFGSPACYTS